MLPDWFIARGTGGLVLPKSVVSDRDNLFVSKFWKELHQLLDIKIKLSTSYHPDTDGSSERSNKTVIESLRNYVNRRQTDWPDHLIHVETAINNSVNATTDYTPTEMVYRPVCASFLVFMKFRQIHLFRRSQNSWSRSQSPLQLPRTTILQQRPYKLAMSIGNGVRNRNGKLGTWSC